MRKEAKKFPQEIRHLVIERQDNRCALCGWFGNLSVHHCIPRSQGGKNLQENAVALCRGEKTPNCHDAVDYLTLEHNIPFEQIMTEGLDYYLQMYPKENRTK